MLGQVEPLQISTKIKAYAYGDKNQNRYEYIIGDMISQGGSGIVYKAKRINGPKERQVILKEYYPYNIEAYGAFFRRDGVIVKKGEENDPYCARFIETANTELRNNWGCSGGDEEKQGTRSSKVCFIDKVLCAYAIITPDDEENIDWGKKTLGVFAEMDSYGNAYSYGGILDSIIEELYKTKEGSEKYNELIALLSPEQDSLSIYGIIILIYSILKSVHTIHDNMWVHRDLKLSNVLLEKEAGDDFLQGLAILIDFGSAKKLIPGTNPLHAEKGSYPYTDGTTQGYQPPEILDGYSEKYHFEGWTKASDIYQIGCIMYHLMCNSFPPVDISAKELIGKIRDILAKYNLHPEGRELVESIIVKSIVPDPALRYPDVDVLVKDVKKAIYRTSPMAEDLIYKERLMRKPTTMIASSEDYHALYQLVGLVEKELSNNAWYNLQKQSILKELGSNPWFNNVSEECLTHLIELADSYDKKTDYKSCVVVGLIYLNYAKQLRDKNYDISINPMLIAWLGKSYHIETHSRLGIRMLYETFRFIGRDGFETKNLTYIYLSERLRRGGGNSEDYLELKCILEAWEQELRSNPNSQKFDFYYMAFCIQKVEVHERDREFSLALSYNEDALAHCKDKINVLTIYESKAFLYIAMKQYEQAIDLCLKALDHITSINLEKQYGRDFYRTQFNLALAEAYYMIDEYNDSARYCAEGLSYCEELMKRHSVEFSNTIIQLINIAKALDTSCEGEYIDKLRSILDQGSFNKYLRSTAKSNPLFDNISASIRLASESEYIPKHCRPVYKKNVNEKHLVNALNSYGTGVKAEDVVAILDPSRIKTGKKGVIFTAKGVCGSCFLTKGLINYDKIDTIVLTQEGRVGLTLTNKQYEEFEFPAAKVLVGILNGNKSIRMDK